MDGMPRPRPPHLHREVTRHGTGVWYVRVGKGPRIRIRAQYGTPEFDSGVSNCTHWNAAAEEGRSDARHARVADRSLS